MPVDKHVVSKFYPTLTPLEGSKVKYLNFATTKAIVRVFFAEIWHVDRAAIDMKYFELELSLKSWIRAPWVDLGGRARGKIKLFSEYGHVAYQIKAVDVCSNMLANIVPTDTSSTQGLGSKDQIISFCESSHVAYQIEGN